MGGQFKGHPKARKTGRLKSQKFNKKYKFKTQVGRGPDLAGGIPDYSRGLEIEYDL